MIWRFTFLVNNPTIQLQTENSFKLIHFLGGIIMKNMDAYIMISIVSLMLVVATAFLMTAADAPIREAGMYLPLIFGAIGTWAAVRQAFWRCTTKSAPLTVMLITQHKFIAFLFSPQDSIQKNGRHGLPAIFLYLCHYCRCRNANSKGGTKMCLPYYNI